MSRAGRLSQGRGGKPHRAQCSGHCPDGSFGELGYDSFGVQPQVECGYMVRSPSADGAGAEPSEAQALHGTYAWMVLLSTNH